MASSSPAVNGLPKKTAQSPRFLVIGCGSRGTAYARAVTNVTVGVIHAVADPDVFKRRLMGRKYVWGDGQPTEGQEFNGWQEWLEWEQKRRERVSRGEDLGDIRGIDGVFVCTLDETHREIMCAIAPLQLHILCEKPLATSLDDCMTIYRSLLPDGPSSKPSKIFSIGHVLRYSPHNTILRKLVLAEKAIGDVVSLEHVEPVGWWHFSHSYVRGNWRRETAAKDGSLLAKCCHDIDFILWLLCSPPPNAPADFPHHVPRAISSMGSLVQFRRSRKPVAAGDATNCLSCPAEKGCNYSALKIYRDHYLAKGDTRWPVNIVCPDIEDVLTTKGADAAEAALRRTLAEDYDAKTTPDAEIAARPWYGRCVWESDNDVCDDQVVIITWDEDPLPDTNLDMPTRIYGRGAKTATLHMIAPTEAQCERRGRVYGTLGEIEYDSQNIWVYNFATRSKRKIEVPKQPTDEEESHGGGDHGLARSFVAAVNAVENQAWDVTEAQATYVGCTLEEAVRSHAVVFAAEEARREERVVRWKSWWEEKIRNPPT